MRHSGVKGLGLPLLLVALPGVGACGGEDTSVPFDQVPDEKMVAELSPDENRDDFGVGLSSLSGVARLPVSALRVSPALLAEMESDSRQAALIEAIVAVGKAFGLETLAQGVQAETQLQRLERLGCDAAQGTVIADAMPVEDVSGWLERAA